MSQFNNDWEQCKENIQPLKQGRDFNAMMAALNDDSHQMLNRKRTEFETELRSYSGSDPLVVWHNYINWVEQHYPTGGKSSSLKTLLEKCFTSVNKDEKLREQYRNDRRFLELWLKYITVHSKALEVFQVCQAKNILTELSDFYEAWAEKLELSGNPKKTEEIYTTGLAMAKDSTVRLQLAYEAFQYRKSQQTEDNEEESEEAQRAAFNALSLDSKNRAPHERVEGSLPPQRISLVTGVKPKTNVTKSGPAIYQDENAFGDRFRNTAVPSVSGLATIDDKENVIDPGKWNQHKPKDRQTVNVPITQINQFVKPSFEIYRDETFGQKRAVQLPVSSNILKEWKHTAIVQEENPIPLFVPDPDDPRLQPQYDKAMVYQGSVEFSFEELNAMRWMKKEEERRHEEEERRREEEEKVKASKELLKKDDEIKNLKLKMEQQQKMLEKIMNRLDTNPAPAQSSLLFEDSWVAIDKSVNQSVMVAPKGIDESVLHCNMTRGSPQIQDPICEESFALKLDITAPMPDVSNLSIAPASADISSITPPCIPTLKLTEPTPVTSCSFNASAMISPPSPSFCEEPPAASHTGRVVASDGFKTNRPVAESPTVNTREVQKIMTEMVWATSFNLSKVENSLFSTTDEEIMPPPSEEIPFTIFRDPTPKKEDPFKIFHDENAPSVKPANPLRPAGLSERPAGLSERPAGLSERPAGLSERPAGLSERPAGLSERPAGLSERPAGLSERPAGLSERPAGLSERPAGLSERPSGLSERLVSPAEPSVTPSQELTGTEIKSTVVSQEPTELQQTTEQDENKPPEDYVKPMLKRKCSGVLQPVFDLPTLETEGKKEEMDDSLAMYPPCDEVTMRLPGNISAFANQTHVASTPASWSSKMVPQPFQQGEDFTMALPAFRRGAIPSVFTRAVPSSATPAPPPPLDSLSIERKNLSTIVERSSEQTTASDSSTITSTKLHTNTTDSLRQSDRSDLCPDKTAKVKACQLPNLSTVKESPKNKDSNGFDPDVISELLFNDEEQPVAKTSTAMTASLDPFSDDVINELLTTVNPPLNSRAGYIASSDKLPPVKANSRLNLGDEHYFVKKMKGQGAYAKVYHASTVDPMNVTIMPSTEEIEDTDSQMILKVQKPASEWEFYVCHEIRERLKKNQGHMLDSVMRVNRGYFFPCGSVLVSQYHPHGTLLDIINQFRSKPNVHEALALYFMAEVLQILEAVHACGIIHADVKPDNFIVRGSPSVNMQATTAEETLSDTPQSLKLIDFGRAIDMKLLPEGTTFNKKVTTDCFTCCEMQDGRPWTYQIDLYGAAAIAHTLLWGSYMNVTKVNGKWQLKGSSFKRYWDPMWPSFFDTLLNIKSCTELPKLQELRQLLCKSLLLSTEKKKILQNLLKPLSSQN